MTQDDTRIAACSLHAVGNKRLGNAIVLLFSEKLLRKRSYRQADLKRVGVLRRYWKALHICAVHLPFIIIQLISTLKSNLITTFLPCIKNNQSQITLVKRERIKFAQ